MRNLYSKLGIRPDADASEIELAIARSRDSDLKNDASIVLLNTSRRKRYDRLNFALTQIGQIRCTLGLEATEFWGKDLSEEYADSAERKSLHSRYLRKLQAELHSRKPTRRRGNLAMWSALAVLFSIFFWYATRNETSGDQESLASLSVSGSPDTPDSISQVGVVVVKMANVRNLPTIESSVVLTIPKDTQVIITNSIDKWYAIELSLEGGMVSGYITSSLVALKKLPKHGRKPLVTTAARAEQGSDSTTRSLLEASAQVPAVIYSKIDGRAAKSTDGGKTWIKFRVPATGYIIVQPASLREEPSFESKVIANIAGLTEISVYNVADEWHHTEIETAQGKSVGYIDSTEIRFDSYDVAKREFCYNSDRERPESGSILLRAKSGNHEIKVKAAKQDVVVKLKALSGSTTLSFYVRAFETGHVKSVSDGSYTVYFASGKDYSARCGIFLDGMNVQKDANPAVFLTTREGNYEYYSVAEYELIAQVNGNFQPSRSTVEEFED